MNRDHRDAGKSRRLLRTALAAALLLAGCSQPYPQRNQYSLNVGSTPNPLQPPAAPATAPAGQAVLRVDVLRIAAPYSGNDFIYKVGANKYTSDYYNGFIASPQAILTGELIQWLGDANIFKAVVDSRTGIDHRLTLEGNVTALYGDYTDLKAPAAVVEIKFFLIREKDADAVIIRDKLYSARVPLSGRGASLLVAGWGEAYRQILQQLTDDLRMQ